MSIYQPIRRMVRPDDPTLKITCDPKGTLYELFIYTKENGKTIPAYKLTSNYKDELEIVRDKLIVNEDLFIINKIKSRPSDYVTMDVVDIVDVRTGEIYRENLS